MVTPAIRFECRKCPAVFPDFEGLVDHWESEHNPKLDLRTVKEIDDLNSMRESSKIKG